jgi:alpha-beta hydrolase superfamily lysophospholipase
MPDDFWLSTGRGSVLASQFWPTGTVAPESVGVVLVPGIAHEYHSMHFGLVTLARELATVGVPALVIDLAGTAQGSGTLGDPDLAAQWGDDVRCAVDHLRRSGLRHVAVVGTRLGALIAVDALASDPVDLVVLWAPVLSGRRYVRELQMIEAAASDTAVPDLPGLSIAGYNLPPGLLDHLRGTAVDRIAGKPASRVCLVDVPDRLAAIDVTRTPLAEVPVDRVEAAGTDDWLFSAADGMVAPFADIPTVIAAIRRPFRDASEVTGRPGAIRPDVSGSRRQEFEHDGVMIRETIVRFGRLGLSGILSEPASVDADVGGPAYVAITALGPGRLFPDFARRAAARGRTCLRFDLAGFGTSPRRPGDGWADFYDPEAPAEIADAIDHVTRRGHDDVVLVAFCAGAWSAVQMAPHPAVRRIVGINLQLFIRHRLLHRRPWPDLPPTKQVLASIGQRRNVRRVVKRLQFSHPLPSPTLRWIRRHRRAGVDVMLVFAEEDRGSGYYRDRVESSRSPFVRRGLPTVRRYEGLGHLPSGTARSRMLDDILSAD